MTTLRSLWKRIPRSLRLAVDWTAVGLLLLVIALFLRYKSLSTASAFRRAVTDAACEPAELELLLELEDEDSIKTIYGFGAGERYACSARLYEDHGWTAAEVFSAPAVEQDVWYLPIDWSELRWDLYTYGALYDEWNQREKPVPCFAVRCPGVTATLAVVLETGTVKTYEADGETSVLSQGGRFPLVLQQAENGWFVFRFDTKELHDRLQMEVVDKADKEGPYDVDYDYRYEEPYESYVRWIARYPSDGWTPEWYPKASLELTAWDENGSVVRHTSWELP
jgi:hypothetical protein